MLHYETFTNIVVDLGLASLGISYLRITGILSVKFKPILPELPVFTAIQLLFLNSPKVDIKFAKGLEIANLSIVHDLIQDNIDKALADLMVLPNIIKINWADPDEDSTLSFQNLLPANVIRLAVIEGRDFRCQEGSLMKRTPDSFARITIGSQEVVTRTVGKSANPVWQEEFDMLVYDGRQFVGGTVYDIDFAGRNRAIGTLKHVPVSHIVANGEDGLWIELHDTPGSVESAILIRCIMFELCADPQHMRECIGINFDEEEAEASHTFGGPEDSRNSGDTLEAERSKSPREIEELPAIEDEQVAENTGGLAGLISCDMAGFLPSLPAAEDAAPEINATEEHAGAVALLIVMVAGGHIPKDLCDQRALIDIKVHTDGAVRAGKTKVTQKVADLEPQASGTISEKHCKVINRLADQGLKAPDIAQALDEDEIEVQRIIRRRGWNMSLPQKMCVFLHQEDLEGATCIDVSLHFKKKTIARGTVPIRHVLNHFSMRHSEILKCRSPKGNFTVDLDAEFRLYSLYSIDQDDNAHTTSI
jgi:hypothetical protein